MENRENSILIIYKLFQGQDYGFTIDPTTLIEIAVDKVNRKIYCKEHYCQKGLITSQIAKKNIECAGKGLIISDNAEPRLVTELKSYGLNIQAPKKRKY